MMVVHAFCCKRPVCGAMQDANSSIYRPQGHRVAKLRDVIRKVSIRNFPIQQKYIKKDIRKTLREDAHRK